jgi:hypothetical protein
MVGLENDNYPVQHLLGAQILVGPWRMIIEKASFSDFEEVKKNTRLLAPANRCQLIRAVPFARFFTASTKENR